LSKELTAHSNKAKCDDITINNLRKKLASDTQMITNTPDVEIVTIITKDLISKVPLKDTIKKLKIKKAKDSEKVILDVIATFGTWLTHSEGKNSELEQMELFEVTPGSSKTASQVPLGYEPTASHKRDIVKALNRIVSSDPTPEVIARFVARTYKVRSASLDHAIVAGVWGFASRNRLDKIALVSDDKVFISQIIAAYDLIKFAMLTAQEKKLRLIKFSKQDKLPLTKLSDLAKSLSWLSEYEFAQLAASIELAKVDPSSIPGLKNQLNKLVKRIEEMPDIFSPVGIHSLTAGQIKRISAAAGLVVDHDPDQRGIEFEIRQSLKKLGLGNDSDLLLPEAIRASEKGRLDDFWSVMQNRVEGDLTWAEQLQELTT
jgi:hypothetical protein